MSTTIATLAKEPYVSLRTFKKNGDAVDTPIWFAIDNGKIYGYTNADAWKVKRMRNTPRVEVAPCEMRGKVTGEFASGTAIVLANDQLKYVHGILNRKYTWKKRIFEAIGAIPAILRIRAAKPDAVFEISLD